MIKIEQFLDDELYTFRDVSRLLKYSDMYFGNLRQKHPEYFKDIRLKPIGQALVITGKDVKIVLSQVKKEGDPPKAS